MNQNKPGYILILTLMAMSLMTVIITQMYYQSNAYLPIATLNINRTKAQMLALGGVQMALSKLYGPQQELKKNDNNQDFKQLDLLKRVLVTINRWQTITLSEEIDGVIGEIKICICCENGKINLNQLYDFEKHAFKDVKCEDILKQTLTQIGIITKNQFDSDTAFNGLINFLRQRNYQLLDVTELLQIPEFTYFNKHVFYEPVGINLDQENNPIYLTDIFTIWTDQVRLEPWFLSDSILAILGFPRAELNDIMKRNSAVSDWTKEFKKSANWQTDWNKTLGVVYKIKVDEFPKKIIDFFDNKFNPQVFSVLSYGTVNGITQKIYAIIKLQPKNKNDSFFVVEKLYWI